MDISYISKFWNIIIIGFLYFRMCKNFKYDQKNLNPAFMKEENLATGLGISNDKKKMYLSFSIDKMRGDSLSRFKCLLIFIIMF